MKEQYIISGYHITTDPDFQNEKYGVTPELQEQLEDLYYEAQDKNNKKIIAKLTDLILKYPTVPILKNYLSVAYNFRENHKKAKEINEWIVAEHPDYLFGKINQANVCIENEEFDKVEEILGKSLELKALYPERELFHLSEVASYYNVVIRYLAAIENMELAENRMELLKEIAPDHHATEEAETFLYPLRLKDAAARFAKEKEMRISPNLHKQLPESQKTEKPVFIHPEINDLYKYNLTIPSRKLEAIIALPHETLVQDLELVLEDAVERYNYYSKRKWDEERNNFLLHALCLLMEIDAKESLPQILSFLSNHRTLLDYWLGDHVTLTVWHVFYKLGSARLELLKEFILTPGIDTYSKSAISEALCQMVLHQPETRESIVKIYSDVFNSYASATPGDDLLDSDFLGLAITDVMNCKLHELLPEISTLFDKKYVGEEICGQLKDVEKAFFKEELKPYRYRKIFNIFELYNDITTNWYGYKEEKPDVNDYPVLPQFPSSKVGRNDPCPCGSGKKFKKCCINNKEE